MSIETGLCNLSLGRIGKSRINDYEADTSVAGGWCREFYPQTRDALLRSFEWKFSIKRMTLSENTTAPNHEWANAFDLPADFIRLKKIYDMDINSYSLEGNQILTDDDTIQIEYVAQITDPALFDELFTEIFVLQLAIKLLPALAGAGASESLLMKNLQGELIVATRLARRIDRQEGNNSGVKRWNQYRGNNERADLSYSDD